tara:strand:- start:108 stop:1094 length:987 start_codon:yes stop_codon:yes gene_type:complete
MNPLTHTYETIDSLSEYNDCAIDYLLHCAKENNVTIGLHEFKRKEIGDILLTGTGGEMRDAEILQFANALLIADREAIDAYLTIIENSNFQYEYGTELDRSQIRCNGLLADGFFWWQKFFWLMHEFQEEKVMRDPMLMLPWSNTNNTCIYNIHPGGTRKWSFIASDAISAYSMIYDHHIFELDIPYKKSIESREQLKDLFQPGWTDRGTFYVIFPYELDKSVHPELCPHVQNRIQAPFFTNYVESWMRDAVDKIYKDRGTDADLTTHDKTKCFILHYTETPLEKIYNNIFGDRKFIMLKERMHSSDEVEIGNLVLYKTAGEFTSYAVK